MEMKQLLAYLASVLPKTTVTNNIGETKRRLKDRFNEHRTPVDEQTNSSIKPTTVSVHFLCNNHNPTDMQLIPLELVKSNRDSVRKAREAYLIERGIVSRGDYERGQTLEPHGLNKKDETLYRVVKGIFVTRDRPFFFPVKCEMATFFFVNRDFHSSREA